MLGDACDRAKKLITGERQSAHGKPEDSFEHIRKLWNAYLSSKHGIELKTNNEVAIMLALFKIGRELGARLDDNVDDEIQV